jgi:hypothetical protein
MDEVSLGRQRSAFLGGRSPSQGVSKAPQFGRAANSRQDPDERQ